MLSRFNSPKCETNARLCIARIRLLKNKKNTQLRSYRKDIADLLRSGKLDYAIIRVESVIREQLTLTAFEILELFLELVAVRTAMIAQSKTIPGDMMEAVSSVLYASARCPELEELVKLRALFEQKYGKEYVSCAVSDRECARFSVNERLIRCLTVEPPPPDVKLQALSEIAQEYAVEWDAAEARRVLLGEYGGSGSILGDAAALAVQQQQPLATDTGLLLAPPVATPAQPAAAPVAPPVVGGEYADIAAAAQAAAVAAQQARAAADAAARMAGVAAAGAAGGGASGGHHHQPPSPPPAGGGGAAVAASSTAPQAPVLQQGWLADMENFTHIAHAGGGGGGDAASTAPVSAAAATAGQPGTSSGSSGFRVPSSEEVQRAYDAAQGPPPKPAGAGEAGSSRVPRMAPPPAAPPVKATDADIAAAAAAGGSGASSGVSDLPSVPGGGSGGGGAAAGASEFDELQRRFEALKKS